MGDRKIIIDTDPGVDDALAIAFGIKAGLPIESICTVYGNSTIDNCTVNALTILELVKGEIEVYEGADRPMKGKSRLAEAHGDNGLGGFILEMTRKAARFSAIEHYESVLERAGEGTVTLVSIGPSTNLALLLEKRPELFKKIDKVIVMGGVFGERGNVTPYAEFNVYNDPLALDMVLNSGHPRLIIVPANVCRKVTFTKAVFDRITNPQLASGLAKISEMYIKYYSTDKEFGGFEGGVMYDLLAIDLLVNPDLFGLKKVRVTVETQDEEKYGLTQVVEGLPNCELVTDVDFEKLKEEYVSIMNR